MRIVVTGIGSISAIASDATVDRLRTEQTGIRQGHCLGGKYFDLPLGRVPLSDEQLAWELSVSGPILPRNALLGIWAAKETLACAKMAADEYRKVTFFNGTTVGGMDLTEQYYKEWRNGGVSDMVAQHEAHASTLDISNYFGGFGEDITLSTACSSALNALISGANRLRAGWCEYALVGGTESLTRFHLEGFRSLHIVDESLCRPFSSDRNGLNLGEGAAYLMLETEEHAVARGATIYAYLAGYANACDAYHQTASSPQGEGAYRSMTGAIEMAHISPDRIDYINAHGTATPNNDESEMAAFRRVFGEQIPQYSSTKAYTGHTTSASGAIEAVFCVQCLRQSFMPASLGCGDTDEGVPLPVQHTTSAALRYVLSNAFGFGGNCSTIIFSSIPSELPMLQVGETTLTKSIAIDEPSEVGQYLSPLQLRRLTPMLALSLASALKALRQEDIAVPDAILCATRNGSIMLSRQLLDALVAEEELSPTRFMQSTHNTLAALVAQHTAAHGYNCTYSCGVDSEKQTLREARLLVGAGIAKNALVLCFDEADEIWQQFFSDRLPSCHYAYIVKPS